MGHYKKNFLEHAILRVDFSSQIEKLKEEINIDVKNKCMEFFPVFETQKIHKKEISVKNTPEGNPDITNKETEDTFWNFFNPQRNRQLAISSNFVHVDYKDYLDFENFGTPFCEVLTELLRKYPDIKPNRLGLRYVDKIRIPDLKKQGRTWGSYWKKYIAQNLLCGINFADDEGNLSRQMNSIEMNYDEDFMLRFQYGIFNEDYPATNKRTIFTIDTDIYSMKLFTLEEIRENIIIFNKKAEQWFEKSIKDPLREIMGKSEL